MRQATMNDEYKEIFKLGAKLVLVGALLGLAIAYLINWFNAQLCLGFCFWENNTWNPIAANTIPMPSI